VPSSYGLQIWPAAHPSNPQHVDLVIAPSAQCAQLTSAGACAAAASIAGADGVTRFVVGTAAAFHMEAGETLTCAAPA
jgi:ADP-ribosylglycohydrolase